MNTNTGKKTYKFSQVCDKNLQVLENTQQKPASFGKNATKICKFCEIVTKTCKFWQERDKNLQVLARMRQEPASFDKNTTKTCKFWQEHDKNCKFWQEQKKTCKFKQECGENMQVLASICDKNLQDI